VLIFVHSHFSLKRINRQPAGERRCADSAEFAATFAHGSFFLQQAGQGTVGAEFLFWPRIAGIGGVLVLFGARMAGGCTSGHGLSGGLQLALSSWVFLITMFIVGVLFAALLFRSPRKEKGRP
jgi:uncharacterized membrane protein YedE/YeeE